MKKILLLAALGGLFAATAVQAQQSIYICGSTAFRANAYRAIRDSFDSSPAVQINAQGKGTGAGLMTFQGKMTNMFGPQIVTIYCDWTGSAQGIHSLTASPGDSLTFLTNPNPDNDTNSFTHTADLAFSDVFQLTSGFNTPTLTDEQVAIQPFVWVRSPGTPSSVSNLTIQQLRFALQGSCPLSYLTGVSNDIASTVYFTGRNKDSGSRLISLSDSLYSGSYGVYMITNGVIGKMTTNQMVNGINYGAGFSSGGVEALDLTNTGPSLVGYEGYADARTVVGGGGQLVNYDGGLPFNGWAGTTNGFDIPDFSPVTTGKYSMWGPEHLFINPSGANFAAAYPVFTNLQNYVDLDVSNTANLPVTAIRLSAMGNTSRTADGGKITP
jgi:hypothetical protein